MPHLTWRQIAVILSGVLAVLTFAVGIYGIVTGPQDRHGSPPDGRGRSAVTDASIDQAEPSTGPSTGLTSLPLTDDPIAYARAVAMALFEWDTTIGSMPADVSAPVLADADPTGQETPGLLTDLSLYLPTDQQWVDLAGLEVSQRFEISSAVVPREWPRIVASSHGQLDAGSAAVTISGTRERTGVWNDEPASASSKVSFTVFMGCPPTFDRCRVLRLSQLNNPLP